MVWSVNSIFQIHTFQVSYLLTFFLNQKYYFINNYQPAHRSVAKWTFPITTQDFLFFLLKHPYFLQTSSVPELGLKKNPNNIVFTLSFFKKYNFGFWKKIGSCHHHFMASIHWAAVDAVLLNLRKFLRRSLSFRNINGIIIIHNFNHNDIYFMILTWRIRDETKMTICLHTQIIFAWFIFAFKILLKLCNYRKETPRRHECQQSLQLQ